jgi:hypothetical protein
MSPGVPSRPSSVLDAAIARCSGVAAAFDGSSGFIDLGNPDALQSNSGTVTAWVKTTSTDSGYHAIAIKWYAYGQFVQGGDLVTYDWSTNTNHNSGIDIADGHWRQVATYQHPHQASAVTALRSSLIPPTIPLQTGRTYSRRTAASSASMARVTRRRTAAAETPA